MTPEREREIRIWTECGGDLRNAIPFVKELLAEIGRIRSEVLMPGSVRMVSENYICTLERENDKMREDIDRLVSEKQRNYDKHDLILERDALKAELNNVVLVQWKEFRQNLRQILYESGVLSNPGWTETNIVDAFKEIVKERDGLKASNDQMKFYLNPLTDKAIAIDKENLSLKARIGKLREAMHKNAERLDTMKFQLYASVYTLVDDEYETVFFVRDDLQMTLTEDDAAEGGK